MPLDPKRLMGADPTRWTVSYDDRQVLLYAIALGLGSSGAEEDLPFVHERGLRPIPSFATSLAFDDTWLPAAGIDLATVVHGGLDLAFRQPFPASGDVGLASRIVGLVDKGSGRGGIVAQEITLSQGGAPACTILSSLFVRGGGGFGGSMGREASSHAIPNRPADAIVARPTAANQALLFRLLGDRNPLHVDPAVARAAGFDRPILHGACTFGVACAVMIRELAGGDSGKLTRLAARFAGPLYPGETLDFALWRSPGSLAFRATARERGAIVLDNGFASVANG